jgi:hypothetical protein
MNKRTDNTTTLPGKTLSIKARFVPQSDQPVNSTAGAILLGFKEVEPFLSSKPLRAPRSPKRDAK